MTKTGFLIATTAVGLVLGATSANAAGYAIKETSATQLGNAFAGSAALKGDVSSMWNNPATMTSLKGNHAAVSASYIIPHTKLKNASSSTGMTGNNGGNAGDAIVVPALYGMWSLLDNIKLGLAITSPFGLKTEYDRNWIGRQHAVKSEMKTVNINPNIAFKVNDFVSLGMGLSFQYMDVELTKESAAAGNPLLKTSGDDWGAGFNVGMTVEPWAGSRFGVAYRSQVKHGLRGTLKTDNVLTANVTADVTTPDSLDFAFSQALGEAWTVLGSAVYTRWNHFNELDVRSSAGPSLSYERQSWKNVWFFSLGANWKFAESWMLRLGAAFDQSPVSDQYRTPKLPGNDRAWVSTGLDWDFAKWGKVALTYTHVFVKNAKMNQTLPAAVGGANLQGTFQSHVDIIGLQANFKF